MMTDSIHIPWSNLPKFYYEALTEPPFQTQGEVQAFVDFLFIWMFGFVTRVSTKESHKDWIDVQSELVSSALHYINIRIGPDKV